jgi:hypothetical protein
MNRFQASEKPLEFQSLGQQSTLGKSNMEVQNEKDLQKRILVERVIACLAVFSEDTTIHGVLNVGKSSFRVAWIFCLNVCIIYCLICKN